MSKRRKSPPLYELLQTRDANRRAPDEDANEAFENEDSPATASIASSGSRSKSGWFSPGETVRLPIGYIFVAAAIFIIMLVIAHEIGFARAERQFEADLAARRADELAAIEAGRQVTDPLVERDTASQTRAGSPPPQRTSPRTQGAGPIESDPRQPGLNYLIILHAPRAHAIETAEFCRREGLEAYAIPVDNQRLQYQVFLLPGFPAGTLESDEVVDLRRKAAAVGRKWEQVRRGNANFQGSYFALHRRPSR